MNGSTKTQGKPLGTSPWRGRLQTVFAILGLFLLVAASGAVRAQTDPQALISALTSGDVYVDDQLRSGVTVNGRLQQVDEAALQAAVEKAKPTVVKIVALPSGKSIGNYPSGQAFANDLRDRLNLPKDGVVVVGTLKGIYASSEQVDKSQTANALKTAGLDSAFAQGGLTAALVRATEALSGSVVSDRRSDTAKGGGWIFGGLVLVGGLVAFASLKKKKAMDEAREPVIALRKEALENLSYVDGYLDVLPAGADGERATQLRASAYEAYSTANGILQTGKTPEQIKQAGPLLIQAVAQLKECRSAIDKATGGTGVLVGLPSEMPNLQTDAQKGQAYLKTGGLTPVEAVQSAQERDRLQAEINNIPEDQRGVSFFSGQPLPASELVPVTIVVQGQKRTVMASRDEAEAIARGETPQVRAFPDANGRYVPWYENRGYDPYRDYYGGWGYNSGVGTFVDLYLLSNLLGGGMFGGYGPWGWGGWGWGMPSPPIIMNDTYYAPDYTPGGGMFGGNSGSYGGDQNSGGFDLMGQGGGNMDPAPEHSGGFEFFGGGGDSGSDSGGSFDFGGGDSGGSDFGGGDSGGGGGDW